MLFSSKKTIDASENIDYDSFVFVVNTNGE